MRISWICPAIFSILLFADLATAMEKPRKRLFSSEDPEVANERSDQNAAPLKMQCFGDDELANPLNFGNSAPLQVATFRHRLRHLSRENPQAVAPFIAQNYQTMVAHYRDQIRDQRRRSIAKSNDAPDLNALKAVLILVDLEAGAEISEALGNDEETCLWAQAHRQASNDDELMKISWAIFGDIRRHICRPLKADALAALRENLQEFQNQLHAAGNVDAMHWTQIRNLLLLDWIWRYSTPYFAHTYHKLARFLRANAEYYSETCPMLNAPANGMELDQQQNPLLHTYYQLLDGAKNMKVEPDDFSAMPMSVSSEIDVNENEVRSPGQYNAADTPPAHFHQNFSSLKDWLR